MPLDEHNVPFLRSFPHLVHQPHLQALVRFPPQVVLQHLLQFALAQIGVFLVNRLDGIVHLLHVFVVVLDFRQLATEPAAELVDEHARVRADVPLGAHDAHQGGRRRRRALDDGVHRNDRLPDEVNGRKGREDAATEAVDVQVDGLGRDGQLRMLGDHRRVLAVELDELVLQSVHRVLGHAREEVDVVAPCKTPRRDVRLGQVRTLLGLGAVVLSVFVVVGWWCGLPLFLLGGVRAVGSVVGGAAARETAALGSEGQGVVGVVVAVGVVGVDGGGHFDEGRRVRLCR